VFTIDTRYFLDRANVRKKIGEGRARALTKAGAMVYRSAQNQLLRGRPSPRGSNRTIGEYRGLPLVERRKRKPKPGRVTSYRTARNANGFLRSAMGFAWDPQTNSVVIGPRRMQSRYSTTLNILQEKGGSQSQRMYLRYSGRPIPRQVAFGLRRTGARSNLVYVGTFMAPRPTTSNFRPISLGRTVRVPAGQYQKKGLGRVRNKIAQKFRNQIYGP
jgi:hypothetical protein